MLAAVYRGDRAAVDRMLAEGATLTLCEAAALGDADAGARADDGKAALAIATEKGHAAAARRLRGEMP